MYVYVQAPTRVHEEEAVMGEEGWWRGEEGGGGRGGLNRKKWRWKDGSTHQSTEPLNRGSLGSVSQTRHAHATVYE